MQRVYVGDVGNMWSYMCNCNIFHNVWDIISIIVCHHVLLAAFSRYMDVSFRCCYKNATPKIL